MPRLYLVRHGAAEAGWGEEYDPGLNDLGKGQARAIARGLAHLGPLNMITSPLVRAKETAEPLAGIWGCSCRVEGRVGEIPSPTEDLVSRAEWLEGVMGKRWSQLGKALQTWRRAVVEGLCALDVDTVVFTHFIAINVAVGEATGDDRVVCFWPDNGSITLVEVDGSTLTLIQRGHESVRENGSVPGIL